MSRRHIFLSKSKTVHIRIQSTKLVGIVESTEEFSLNFLDSFHVKFQVVPRRRIRDEIPARGIRSEFFNRIKWIHHISEPLTHLVSILVKYQAIRHAGFISYRV